ncbi:uncharacterized protein LOC132184663 [Corylus avellana]|uniref:uncharacterized protein LOC132184663 n=1 Tax=Corylus avellana TaxID=13451 RepID=UPI001E23E488|nr:uncharacterized protein LOC132184663 [Corylus avellana]
MAKRSDFAQKLLDDLRSRKERIAASQSSNRSNSMAVGAYTYSKQTHKGSRSIKAHENMGSRTTNMHNNRSTGINRSSIIEEGSKQIVPYARGRSSEQVGDLSMALAFAIENGGMLRRTDSSGNNSVLGFLNQIGRRSMERSSAGRHRSSSSGFPNLSHLHIKEISKGAEKLNQILRACSSGLNFDRYSIEIGKELLKGAMDLEESLRMLVNLQDASDYMVSPQRKNRIILLEDDEDNEDNTVREPEQKQLGRPRFSFDKSSSHFHNFLTYPTEAANYNHGNQALVTSRSASHIAAFPEQRNHSSSSRSNAEKGRIPNVIAKLMGLDEIPQHLDRKQARQKDSTQKQKIEGVALQGSTKNAVLKTKDTKDLEPSKRQKVVEAKRKPPQKDLEGIQPGTSSEKAFSKNEKQQSSMPNQNNGSRKNIQERRQDDIKHREQKGTGMGNTKETIAREHRQQMEAQASKRSEAAVTLQGKAGYKESMLQTEKRYTNTSKLLPNNNQQRYSFQKPEQQEEKNHGEEREQQSAKQKLQGSKQRGSEINLQKKHQHMSQATHTKRASKEAVRATQSEGFPTGRHHEDLVNEENSRDLNFHMKSLMNRNSDQNYSPRDMQPESGIGKARIPPVMEEKPLYIPATPQKAKSTKAHKSETPRKIDEVATRRNGTLHNFARPLKHQSSILQEAKPRMYDKLSGYKGSAEQVRISRPKEAESHIIKSNKSASIIQQLNVAELAEEAEHASHLYSPPGAHIIKSNKSASIIQQLNVAELAEEAEHASHLYSPPGGGYQRLKEPILPSNASSQRTVPTISRDQQDQVPVFGGDEFKAKFTSRDISYPSQPEHQKMVKSGMQEPPLTESENCLKKILITSELFLNTAEALFMLNIPFEILNAGGGHDCTRDEESKLILDCGYEVMKRKGRRQELIAHPCVKISIGPIKVSSLDDLVKQLYKDFDTLKLYGRNGNPACDVEDYLPEMLEIDVHNRDTDVNCMWDLGWNDIVFALLEKDDVVRDVEKHVFHGLIEEITRDLLHVCV